MQKVAGFLGLAFLSIGTAFAADISATCKDGSYWITDRTGTLPISYAAYNQIGFVKCNNNQFSVNGKSITKEQLDKFVAHTVEHERQQD
ncbi:hypothetical protein LDJ79_16650 [Vibrio tritonius]|uniref:Uncharacterized protein n=1 Tax=Vibrio tritonius TaxID=1435069 RepID=A0ABS7YQ09_9VIBR|nr:hypothetical protein [Vibrio tritonius]MCA2017753.1 hypothetical protein [Vibrio tritonius]